MKTYVVEYKMTSFGDVKTVQVEAANAVEAYQIATYETIVQKEHKLPYSSWISAMIHKNGRWHCFNNHEGKAY